MPAATPSSREWSVPPHPSAPTALWLLAIALAAPAHAQSSAPAGAPFGTSSGDWRADAPGKMHRIVLDALPPPFASNSSNNTPSVVAQPPSARLRVPPGFAVQRFAEGLNAPRIVRVAPNGDIFVAESLAGRIRVLRAADGASRPTLNTVFASGLDLPFGIAFYPPGPDPRFIYVANNNAVIRFPYQSGDLQARGAAETVVAPLSPTTGYHWTRDIAFSADGQHMFVSIGSNSNDAEDMTPIGPEALREHIARTAPGAAWGPEERRAVVVDYAPDGGGGRLYATGLRNCVGLAIQPRTGNVWCSTNERDDMGDNLPPDYATRVAAGAFFGWPWYYIGPHEDPRHAHQRPDLAGKITLPDVLIQPHSAPLGMTFYASTGPAAFGADYQGDAFVALHGSWNRATRTGYKIVRIHLQNGVPAAGAGYQDFMTGFVAGDDNVWGRPVGVAVAHDGALLVTEDGNGTIRRIAPTGR
jgi:glucose/arabinose dehydrogenase